MNVKFNEASQENPLNYFEEFFSDHGQRKAKIAFLSYILPRIERLYHDYGEVIDYGSLDYDLEKEVFEEYFSGMDSVTGAHFQDIREHKYIDYLQNKLVKPELKNFKTLLNKRIDGCDKPEHEHYVLRKMLGKINNMSIFLNQNPEVPFGGSLKKLVSNLQKHVESIKAAIPSDEIASNRTLTHNESHIAKQVTGEEKKQNRLSDLSSYIPMEDLMNFLKTNNFISHTVGEVATLNYYFGIGNAKKKPSTKIVWLKDPELLKILLKKGFNQGPKYNIAATVFEVNGISEDEILGWTNRNTKKIKDMPSKEKLMKFIQKYIAD